MTMLCVVVELLEGNRPTATAAEKHSTKRQCPHSNSLHQTTYVMAFVVRKVLHKIMNVWGVARRSVGNRKIFCLGVSSRVLRLGKIQT